MLTKQRGKSSPAFLSFEYQALFIYHLAKFARFAATYSDLAFCPVKHKIFAKLQRFVQILNYMFYKVRATIDTYVCKCVNLWNVL
jgi:hypothetical protein